MEPVMLTSPDTFEADLVGALPKLMAYAVKLSGDRERARDLIQETALRALRYRHQFDPGTNLPAWCRMIMINIFRTEYRRTGRIVEDIDEKRTNSMTTGRTQLDSMIALETLSHLKDIPPLMAEPMMMAADGMEYWQIAETINVPIGTVKSRVHRARQHLRAME